MNTNGKVYKWFWHRANRARRLVGARQKPKACCRREENLGPETRVNESLTFRRCLVCACRHFDATMDPKAFKLTLK